MVSLRAFLNGKKLCNILSDDHQGIVSINHFLNPEGTTPTPNLGKSYFSYIDD